MSIRTTVTLDEDVFERVKEESRARSMSFRDTMNDLLRLALLFRDSPPPRRTVAIKPVRMGLRRGLSLDDVESLIEYGEGASHR